ncbi:biosynthetic-type acetolactate synthase large subunit [Enterococcus sp. 669A]|uniref:Acetolactate synthase n=1 Tax=Candidatus Enterococcus moelleringii TaxID=2815325 RepID=A0ABS3LGF0_9ENTE|nr:biosynthetic-type acetolactate synthase large subunit [Enterococcus sp. 669A]MBO1308723.1 biosynthetic-type acetolactate synthase large subunit [Enterococcus sp. 669A]
MISGAELVVKALIEEAVEVCFAYPGGQAIDLFDALYQREEFRVVLPRHEQGLIHAADGYARSTGKVGVCLVTSGPGATNLITGIATAGFDAAPLVCFTGQVATHLIGKDAFQEVDMVGISRSITKYAVTVKDRQELGAIIKKAFVIAQTGKPGVVVVDLPKNIQQELGSADYPKEVSIRGYQPQIDEESSVVKKAATYLNAAERPVLLVGGGVHRGDAYSELMAFAEKSRIPVVTTIMGKGALPSGHELYIGNVGIHGSLAANHAVANSDVLFAIGTRLNDRVTGKSDTFCLETKIIHLDIDPAVIGKNVDADVALVGEAKRILSQMIPLISDGNHQDWLQQLQSLKQENPLQMLEPGLTPETIINKINNIFTHAIVVTDVGQNQLWTTQFLQVDKQVQLLTSGGLGTMGFGFPAALGAKLGNPEKDVIVITGDGGFQMNLQELATAMLEKIPVIICIFNNGCLGNVRQWQEMFYDKRYSYTDLMQSSEVYVPNFLALAASYGIKGTRVTAEEQIEPAFAAAKESKNQPFLIEFMLEREQKVMPIVPPGQSLKEMIIDGEN